MNLWDETYEHIDRSMLFADELAVPFLVSVGAHIGNLRQNERFLKPDSGREPIWFVNGRPEDLRVPVLTVAPPGFSKSHTMKPFIGKEGILPFPTKFEGPISEAGLVGSIRQGEDGADETRGLAWHYRNGIVAFNEMSNIIGVQEQEKNAKLINQFMEMISEGEVSKTLLAGTVTYHTFITPWGGTQPARLDTSSGVGRRFLFSMKSWTGADKSALIDIRGDRELEGRWDMLATQRIKTQLMDLMVNFDPSEIVVPDDTFDWLKNICKNHLQLGLMEKVLLGRAVLEQGDQDVITLNIDEEQKLMVKNMLLDIERVSIGSDRSLLIQVLDVLPGDKWTKKEIYEEFRSYSYDWDKFNNLLYSSMKTGLIKKFYDTDTKKDMYMLSNTGE